jgi:hypothetical protein
MTNEMKEKFLRYLFDYYPERLYQGIKGPGAAKFAENCF